MGRCAIKYIHLRPDASPYHEPKDFELAQETVEHSSFRELHREVFRRCPNGYMCIEPIALRHEVTWTRAGDEDRLIHALEEKEYKDLDWSDPYHMICLCVDVRTANVVIILE